MSNITNNDEPRKAAYTAGPWRVDPGSNCDVQTADGSLEICSTHPGLLNMGEKPEGKIPQYNARLISAAPDLLEALQKMVQAATYGTFDSSDSHPLPLARAAIAKALGQ